MDDNCSDDLYSKYQRLATEYSKMRAQLTVLKKAFIDEHSKNSELRDNLKVKDQSVTKLEEEVQSIGFRNQELAQRVGVLQEELSLHNHHNQSQSKEHWMLESQLLRVRLERELKKVEELENKVLSSEGTAQQNSLQTTTSTPSLTCNDFAGSSLQSPTVSEDKMSLNSNNAAEGEAPHVTAYLRNRISQLIDSLHTSDSKAVAFHVECVSLQQRLTVYENERKRISQEIENQNKVILELREELATNVTNYEKQLSVMSEHLADMNDKLTDQRDQIDSLKFNDSKARKSRNK